MLPRGDKDDFLFYLAGYIYLNLFEWQFFCYDGYNLSGNGIREKVYSGKTRFKPKQALSEAMYT